MAVIRCYFTEFGSLEANHIKLVEAISTLSAK